MHPKQLKAVAESLLKSPLLAGDLPAAPRFDRSKLAFSEEGFDLNTKQKLGHLYEDVLSRALHGSAQFEVIAKHVQIFTEDRRTLGELDFVLFEAARQRYIHLELAVKFYLAVQVKGTWMYPGPDPRDHWERKLERMESHQFKLAQSPEAKALLRDKWNIPSIDPEQLIYGVIFSPIDTPSAPLPRATDPGCRRGIWLYQKQWQTYFPHVEKVCRVPKYLWPVELDAELQANLEFIPVPELQRRAERRSMLFTLEDTTIPYFLVPDTWPNAAAEAAS